MDKEDLYLYLAEKKSVYYVLKEVSTTLIQEDSGEKKSVYYVSKAFLEQKIRY